GAWLTYLPGAICSGAVEPLDARCREADEPWPLEREPALRANLAHGKNYFDGRVTVPGAAKSVPPFYAAAAAEEQSGRLWIFTRLDRRAWLHDAALDPVAPLAASGRGIGLRTADCLGLLKQIFKPTVIDAVVEPWRFGEEAGEIGFVGTLEHTAGHVGEAFVVQDDQPR